MNAQHCTLQHETNRINYRSQDPLGALPIVCLKKTQAVETLLTRTLTHISGIPMVWALLCNQPLGCMGWSDVRVGIIIFHLFFILILLRRAERSERGKLASPVFLWCPGMFLRGVLEVGHGGAEERANKQVAEGGTR